MSQGNGIRRSVSRAVKSLPSPLDRVAVNAARSARALLQGGAERVAAHDVPDLATRVERAFESGDDAQISAVIKEMHALQERIEMLAAPPGLKSEGRIAETKGVQSIQFMIDLLPHIQDLIKEHPRGRVFDVLDVGPGLGLGTALLAQLYSRSRLGYRMRISALDISPVYKHYLPAITPHVPFIVEDVFDHQKTYDIVIASHVIEHMTDPIPFCRRLQEVARLAVFIVAPFNEPADNLTKGHFGVIDEGIVEAIKPEWYEVVHSAAWGAFLDPPYEMLIARLPGQA